MAAGPTTIVVGRWSMLKRFILVLALLIPILFVREERAVTSSKLNVSSATFTVKEAVTNTAMVPFKKADPPPLPPLSDFLYKEENGDYLEKVSAIKSSPAGLLDIVVIGFAKSGTSTLKQWLDLHPQITMLRGEKHHLQDSPGLLIKKLYNARKKINANNSMAFPHYIGFKNPNEVRRLNTSMAYLRDYFPSTKLIVGVRHPVTWVKSLWDYSLMYLGRTTPWLREHMEIGGPHGMSQGIQTGNAEWHVILALLGKTNWRTDPGEQKLLRDFLKPHELSNIVPPIPNQIFLVETTQMADDNATRAAQLRHDMQQFLGLESELPPILHSNNNHDNNGTAPARPGRAPPRQHKKIDFCAEEFDEVRAELVRIGKAAGQWIGEYFIQSPSVFVSSPGYLKERLQTWSEDPCDNGGLI